MAQERAAWVLGAALCLTVAPPAWACAFHGYTPDPTIVDVLLATEQAVIARRDPAKPGQFIVAQTLIGPDLDATVIAVPGGQAQRQMLLARDGAYGPWVALSGVNAAYRGVIDQIVARHSDWQFGRDKDRLTLFAGYVNDPNPDLRRLALQELDRAPYNALKRLRLPKVQGLQRDLDNGDTALTPIRVLLAGLSKDARFGAVLTAKLDAAVAADVPYLGAYATGVIEQTGRAGVERIAQKYLQDARLSIEIKEKLLQALAIQHKSARGSLRRFITRTVAELSRADPALKAAAARQFGYE